MKASLSNPAPKNRANTTSRTKPKIRDNSVIPLTTDVFSANFRPDIGFFGFMRG